MKTIGRIIIAFVVLVVVAAGGFLGYVWFVGGSGEPSAAAEAERVEPQQPEQVVYEVVDAHSEARFIIDEVLRGEPNTVVGRTDQIDGSVAVQFDPARVDIGQFVINVRTIKTDDEVRDRSIRTLILESNKDEFEFSTFEPTEIAGVPEVIEPGDRINLQVTGDLTVRDVTSPVTFDMTLDVRSREESAGAASTVILWDDFDITIPYVGGNSIVASVAEEVRLELEFVARAVSP
jgi:polyisoprenoid-binding protein YceI